MLDSLLQEVEELVPTLCFRQLGAPPVNKIYGNDDLPEPGSLEGRGELSPAPVRPRGRSRETESRTQRPVRPACGGDSTQGATFPADATEPIQLYEINELPVK